MNPTPEQYKRARELFKQALEHVEKAKSLSWELLSHPDVTAEQLQDAKRVSTKARDWFVRVVTAFRHKWPPTGYAFHPWNNREYDRFYSPSLLKEMTNATAE